MSPTQDPQQPPVVPPAPVPTPPAFNSTEPTSTPVQPRVDPGNTLGIVGLILNVISPLPALIVSIVSYEKSKKAGFGGKLGRIGILVASIYLALSIIFCVAFFFLVIIPSNEKDNAVASDAKSAIVNTITDEKNAQAVASYAEAFGQNYGYYPSTRADFSKPPSDTSTSNISSLPVGLVISGTDPTAANGTTTIGYQYTTRTSSQDPSKQIVNGGRVTYWDYNNSKVNNDVYMVGLPATDTPIYIPIK